MVYTRRWLSVVAIFVCAPVIASPQHDPVDRNDAPIVSHLATTPYPDGVTDEEQYAQWLARHSIQLQEAAAKTENPRRKIEVGLIALNFVLATECEPAMSRFINGIEREDDAHLVAKLTQQSAANIESLRKAVVNYKALDDHDAEAVEKFNVSIDTLAAFSDVLHAIVNPDHSSESVDARRLAGIGLAEYLEDERPAVAVTALLWQSVLYGREGRIDRALRSLPKVTESLHQAVIAFDFFARLLRCRYVKSRGSYATGWALLLTLEERARDWFPSGPERDEAIRSAVFEKISICQSWPDAATNNERERVQSWCDTTSAELRSEHFGSTPQPTLLRLPWAAPIVVDITDPAKSVPETPDPSEINATPAGSETDKTTHEEQVTDPDPKTPNN